MRVTVCELGNSPERLARDWDDLARHVRTSGSELVLLPEMPFFPWPAWTRTVEPAMWQLSVAAHEAWLDRLGELSPAVVLATRPVVRDGRRFNQGFAWDPEDGYRAVHDKYYLPDDEGFWEASWYERGPRDFVPVDLKKVRAGFLICTELWFTEHARAYAHAGARLLVCPRATPASSAGKWLAGGRAAAVVSGAYVLSSCFAGEGPNGMRWAGSGWIIEPQEGDVLAVTSAGKPFVTLDIDVRIADQAQQTYPRYVTDPG